MTVTPGLRGLGGGSGGGGGPSSVDSDSITDATTVGKEVLTAADQSAALTAIGAATAAQGALADSAVQPDDLADIATSGSADDLADGTTNKAYTAPEKTKLAAITGTNTGDETATTIKSKLGVTTLSGSNTGDQTTITGNAGTATKLATARNIALTGAVTGTASFDGSANASIATTAGTLTKANVGLGNVDNTADTAKPISTLTQAALDDKANSDDLSAVATSGDASDLGGTLDVTQAPAASGVFDYCISGTWGGRPTARTDVTCTYVKASASDPDPADFVAGRDIMYQPLA